MNVDFAVGDLVYFEDPDSESTDKMIGVILDIVSGDEMSDSLSPREKEIFDSILGIDKEYYVGLPSFTIHNCMCLVSWLGLKKGEKTNTDPLTIWIPCDYIKKVT